MPRPRYVAAIAGTTLALSGGAPAQAVTAVTPEDGARVPAGKKVTLTWTLEKEEYEEKVAVFTDPANPSGSQVESAYPLGSQFNNGAGGPGSAAMGPFPLGVYYWRIGAYNGRTPYTSQRDGRTYYNYGELRHSEVRRFEVVKPALDKLEVRLTDDPAAEWHEIEVETTPYANFNLKVLRGERVVSRLRSTEYDDADRSSGLFSPRYYYWNCNHTGRHTWTVVATDDYGNRLERTGSFNLGRCYARRDVVRRPQVIRYIDRKFRPDEFVSRIDCRPAPKGDGRAHAHTCFVRWNNARRECEATYTFRAFTTIRFGQPEDSYFGVKQRSRRRCRQYDPR